MDTKINIENGIQEIIKSLKGYDLKFVLNYEAIIKHHESLGYSPVLLENGDRVISFGTILLKIPLERKKLLDEMCNKLALQKQEKALAKLRKKQQKHENGEKT